MLTDDQERVLKLHESQKSISEIADATGKSEAAVRILLIKAESARELHSKYPHLINLTTAQLNSLNRQKITENALRELATNTPEKIYTIRGIGKVGARKIYEAFGVNPPTITNIILEFSPREISYLVRVLKTHGEDCRAPETGRDVLKKLLFAKTLEDA